MVKLYLPESLHQRELQRQNPRSAFKISCSVDDEARPQTLSKTQLRIPEQAPQWAC
jgi:hypothetical protein